MIYRLRCKKCQYEVEQIFHSPNGVKYFKCKQCGERLWEKLVVPFGFQLLGDGWTKKGGKNDK